MRVRTYQTVLAQIEKLQEEAEVLRQRERDGVIDRIKDAIKVYGITMEELMERAATAPPVKRHHRSPSKGKRMIKYADKAGNHWSGGGSVPRWMREHLAHGRRMEEYLVAGKVIRPREKEAA